MQDSEREALRKNRQALLKDLEAKKIASRLFSYNIFSVEDKDEVNSKETKNDQGEALLDILPRKGPKAFKAFCDALHDVSPHLESLLRPIQAEGMPTEGTDGGISTKKPIPSTINPGAAEKENQVEQVEQEIDHPQPPADICVCDDSIYRMAHQPRGIAVIINNKTFQEKTRQMSREGTDLDRDALKKLFHKLLFKLEVHNNKTSAEILEIVEKMSKLDHSNYDAFIFCILSHGEEGVVYGTDDTVPVEKITSRFKSTASLAGKPKIFFFQACQGQKFMEGVDIPDGAQHGKKASVPVGADFLFAHSTVAGYYSWRNSSNGSWFIQSVAKVLRENADHMDLLKMLTRVNSMVSEFESRSHIPMFKNKRQIPCIVSMLRKDFYFFPEKLGHTELINQERNGGSICKLS
ncbi:caspase-3-like isoform X1 [Pocillopora verrucosa]|uniref:caspase-3-like isoform X1 n=1 Tax=Pocillopora verrucosa TaxID=203993 RepID=UPI00333E58EA